MENRPWRQPVWWPFSSILHRCQLWVRYVFVLSMWERIRYFKADTIGNESSTDAKGGLSGLVNTRLPLPCHKTYENMPASQNVSNLYLKKTIFTHGQKCISRDLIKEPHKGFTGWQGSRLPLRGSPRLLHSPKLVHDVEPDLHLFDWISSDIVNIIWE